jgi:hypothetical protein
VSSSTSETPALRIEPFRGGAKWLSAGGLAGVVFLIITLVGAALSPKETWYAYLVAFSYWAGISMVSVILLMIFHATHARWMVILRRPVEAMATSVPIFILLFIPLVIGMKHVYVWIDPPASLGRETLHLLEHKHAWLNPTAFIVRGFFYLVFASFLGWRLFGWSLRQDREGGTALTSSQRKLAAGGLPFIGLSFTFAAFDWLMSLYPTWFSTIFGVYYFAGSIGAALSILAIVTSKARTANLFSGGMHDDHTHSIGKLMLAFTCFWTYVAFSQLLLIWIAGLPEEIPFYITRFKPGWAWLGFLLIFGHFFLPFGLLLSRARKRDPRRLARVAALILAIHFCDIYWLVMPALYPEGFGFHWTSITAFLGVGLLAVAFAVSRLRGKLVVPAKDPYLAESLRYRP